MLTVNQFPFSLVSSIYAEEDSVTKIMLEDDFYSQILLKDKIYDGTKNVEVDFSKVELSGVEDGDDLFLTAFAEFADASAGKDKIVKINDFKLEGDSASSYSLVFSDENKEIELTANIEPAPVYVIPSDTFYAKENFPKKINYTIDRSGIFNNDNVEANAVLTVEKDDKGEYYYQLDDEYLTGNSNYIFRTPDEKPEPGVPSQAIITEAKIEKSGNNILEQYDFGIVSNGDVKIIITAEEDSESSVKFTLSDGQEVEVKPSDLTFNNNKYYAKAEFIIHLEDEENFRDLYLNCSLYNGTETQNIPLQLYINNPAQKTQRLIIDRSNPGVRSMNVVNHIDGRQAFEATAQFMDNESGIKSIQYCWDADYDKRFNNQWNEECWNNAVNNEIDDSSEAILNGLLTKFEVYNNFSHTPSSIVNFNNMVRWNNHPVDTRPYRGGAHILYYVVTDNAGNKKYGKVITNGSDTEAPVVPYIHLEKNTASAWDKILSYLSFGNFVNTDLTLELKVKDVSESSSVSGVKSVELVDLQSDKSTEKTILAVLKENDGVYTYKLSPNMIIENFYVKVTDKNENYKFYSIKSLLQSDAAKEEVSDETDSEDVESDVTAATEETMDWEKLMSEKWVFDNVIPDIEFNYQNEVFRNGVYYYNLSDGKLSFSVKDEGSIKSVSISQTFKNKETDTGKTEKIVSEVFKTEKKEYSFDVETKNLETGWYTYLVEAYDYAGNPLSSKETKIFVDHQKPEGTISVASPKTTTLVKNKTEYWIREKDESEKYLPVTFRIDAVPNGAPLYTIEIDVIGDNNERKSFKYTADKIQTDENGDYYVTALISPDPSSTNYLKYNNEKMYKVEATVKSESDNTGTASFDVHVDTKNPEVEKFSVKKNAAKTILNVLSFGVFANDSVEIIADVSDEVNDIGVDYAEISYLDNSGKKVVNKMSLASDGKYHYNLDYDTKIFQSEISVTVYDKIGKYGINRPTIENTENQSKTDDNCFVMLENSAPSVKVILPESDSTERTDGQIWYRQHENTEDNSDSEKYIEVIVQDVDSGIAQIEMSVTKGDNTIVFTEDMEKTGVALPNYETTGSTKYAERKNLCQEYHFYYSTEKIAAKFAENDRDGKYEISIKAIDNAGNVNNIPANVDNIAYTDSKVTYYRDSVNPSVTQFILDPATFDNISEVNKDDFIEKLQYGYYFKKDFDVMIISEDAEPSSLLDSALLRLIPYENGEEKEPIFPDPIPIVDGKAKYTIPAGFKGQVYAKVFDKVNNTSEERTPQGFVIDESAPVITIEPLPSEAQGKDNNGNKLFTETVQFKVTISDLQSGIRTVSYSKSSESDSHDSVITSFDNEAGYNEGTIDGWSIDKKDINLITEISRVFVFDKDDNDIELTFNAMDRSGNECEPQKSEKFTIDTIAPKVTIVNESSRVNDKFYQGETKYVITVDERNFSPDLMTAKISNSFTSTVPSISFDSNEGSTKHTATVKFPEGDYEFSFSGSDLGGHRAVINSEGGESSEYFFTTFNVDNTAPKIQTNFGELKTDDKKELYFNSDQTAEIVVTEHNFYETDMGISVMAKSSGTGHDIGGDGWYSIGYTSEWVSGDGDKHTLQIKFTEDGIYRISISPKDRAGNEGVFDEDSPSSTAVYEIDKTVPVYLSRNGQKTSDKNFKASPFYDVYDEKRKDEAPPTVEFDDINFDRIEVDTIVYTPTYKNGMELGEIELSPVATELSKPVTNKKFTLSNFNKDGVYAITFVAVDKAGNRSEPINNTYFRMVDTDVLAYIYNSNINDRSGYYSLMGEDGKAISKKATDFADLDILVIKPYDNKDAGKLVLREDENNYLPEEYSGYNTETEEISETAMMIRHHLPGEYFSETFKDDGLNTRMYLSVSIRDDVYLDMASIHIDNEAPVADIPEDFSNWHNFLFVKEQTITLTNVSEKLNDNLSKVYECPRNGERTEIPHKYDPENGTYSFTLTSGVHHIDITLVDEAGNEWNIDRVKYLRVGNFRLYIGCAVGLSAITALGIIFYKRKRK